MSKLLERSETHVKLISWNVNGLRAAVKHGFVTTFNELDADFFCVQETKLQAGQIELDFQVIINTGTMPSARVIRVRRFLPNTSRSM